MAAGSVDLPLATARAPRATRSHAWRVAETLGLLWVLTLAAAATSAAWPTLAPSTPPHPTLRGTAVEAVAILVSNLRVLAAPFVLALFRWPGNATTRRIGDLLVVALICENAIGVGLELGRWRGQLLPYLPHLPLEWLALATAGAAWLAVRHQRAEPGVLVRYAVAVLAVAAAAAACEVLLTPRIADRRPHHEVNIGRPGQGSSAPVWPRPVGDGVGCLHPQCAPAAARRFKVAALPVPRFARFRSAARPAHGGLRQPPRPPQEGSTR
jgi:hypothetical protein